MIKIVFFPLIIVLPIILVVQLVYTVVKTCVYSKNLDSNLGLTGVISM